MEKTRVLAIAVGFDRFTVQDLISATGAADNTVRSTVTELLRSQSIILAGKRNSKVLGRPAKEYEWITSGRETCLAELRTQIPTGVRGPVPAKSDWRSAEDRGLAEVDPDPFNASLALATDFVVALEGGATGEEALQLASRAKSELRVLQKWMNSRGDDDVSAVAALSLRLEEVEQDPDVEMIVSELKTSQADMLRRIAGITESRVPEDTVSEQLEHGFGIVLNVSRQGNPASKAIASAFDDISRKCFTMNVPRRETERLKLLEELSTFLTTQLSAMARVFIVTDGRPDSNGRAAKIVHWFGQISNLRSTARQAGIRANDAVWRFSNEAALNYSVKGLRGRDWLSHGFHKQTAMRHAVALVARHPNEALGLAAAKLALNNPVIIYWTTSEKSAMHDELNALIQRTTSDKRVIKGLVIGSFSTEVRIRSLWPEQNIYDPFVTIGAPSVLTHDPSDFFGPRQETALLPAPAAFEN